LPLYEYACSTCGRPVEVTHGFRETYDQPCASCGGPMTRVFNPAGIVFKGSGFYVNDSRPKTKESGSESKPAEAPKSGTSDAPKSGKPEAAA
jgi:putative FmdB family regulatory protein